MDASFTLQTFLTSEMWHGLAQFVIIGCLGGVLKFACMTYRQFVRQGEILERMLSLLTDNDNREERRTPTRNRLTTVR